MASTYSNLKIELMETGQSNNQWGNVTNTNLGTALEQAIVGMATVATGSFTTNVATLTLSNTNALQDARALVLNVTATLTGAGTINVPAIEKPYLVFNNTSGGYAITVKVSGQTGVSIPNGKKAIVYNNGTDVGEAINYLSTLSLGTALPSTSGGTGLTSWTAGQIPYYATGTALSQLNIGANGYILTSSGTAPQWTAPASVSFGTATNLAGGATGSVPYQSSSGTTTFLSLGTTNYVLTAGASAPQYVAQSTLSVGSATTATTATNVAGGTTGAVHYQTGVGSTGFLSLGTTNYVLTAGASAPQYVAQSTLSVGSATTATTATNIAGGAAGSIPYQTGSGSTAFRTIGTNTYILTSNGSTPNWTAPSSVSIGTATNLSAGSTGSVVYQSASGTTAYLTLGTTNYVLTAGASAPQYVAQSTLSVGSATTATTATNVTGGAAGSLVYQTGSGATSTLALGTSNYVLVAGASAPQYVAQSTLSVGSATTATSATSATTATNIASGTANQIAYQTGSGATSFITAPVSASTYLGWNGSAFAWSAVSVSPGGSNTQLQYNNSGSFGGISSVTWDGTALTIANSKLTGTTSAFASIITNAAETVNITAGAVNSTPTAYFNTGAVQLYTSNASANWTQNLAYSSTTTLNSALAVGQSATIAVMATQGATAYYMNGTLTIDGSSANVTVYWQGGTAPITGFTTGIDVYTYTVIKTAATPAYTVLATQTQF